jgi:glucose-6-phosphate isomerase
MALTLKLQGIEGIISAEELKKQQFLVESCSRLLNERKGAGNDFLGWIDLPFDYDKEEVERIKKAAEKIQKNSEVLIVIGIGGSYLGARAALEFIRTPFYNNIPAKGTPDIYFVGNNISSAYLNDIVKILGDRDFSVNIISKSGTTTEPAIAFRIFKKMLEDKYGKEGAKERIFATTDKARGALKNLCNVEGYETFVIPDDVGGRFSVLTPVGLLPLAAAGIDIDAIMKGAQDACQAYRSDDMENNDCLKYAAVRHCMMNKGKTVEILVNYDPALTMFGEWYKQLFAESQGKDQKGVFPVSANFSTDLHSIGQFIQDGLRSMFETVLWVKNSKSDVVIQEDADNIDGLNFLAGRTMQEVNSKAYQGTMLAHVDGGAPNIVLEVENADEYSFGYLVYFFEKACGVGGYMLGINPFDQPGVESYKKNMFALLGKPGYEDAKQALEARIK